MHTVEGKKYTQKVIPSASFDRLRFAIHETRGAQTSVETDFFQGLEREKPFAWEAGVHRFPTISW